MISKLVWYYVYARIARQMWSERKYWFKHPAMDMKRVDEILRKMYIDPIREHMNAPCRLLDMVDESAYNVVRGK